MTRALPFRPKRPRLFMVTALIAVWSLILALGVTWWRGWSAGDVWGLTFGSIAAVVMFLGALYPLRRRLLIPPLSGRRLRPILVGRWPWRPSSRC